MSSLSDNVSKHLLTTDSRRISAGEVKCVLGAMTDFPLAAYILVFCTEELIVRPTVLSWKWINLALVALSIWLLSAFGVLWGPVVIAVAILILWLEVHCVRKMGCLGRLAVRRKDKHIPITQGSRILIQKNARSHLLCIQGSDSHPRYEAYVGGGILKLVGFCENVIIETAEAIPSRKQTSSR